MPHHTWGDKDFDFDELHDAGVFIAAYVLKKTQCRLMWKEKYGTLRYEAVFVRGDSPCWALNKFRFIYWIPGVDELLRRQREKGWKAVASGCSKAIALYPSLEDEIMEDIAEDERLVGKETHRKYWN